MLSAALARFVSVSISAIVATACAVPSEPTDLEQASGDGAPVLPDKDDGASSWMAAATAHVGDSLYEQVAIGQRQVHSLWLAGDVDHALPIEVVVKGYGGPVRFALLGPLVDGQREVLAAAGYSEAVMTAEASAQVTSSGQHLVVVGSYNLAGEAGYELGVRCTGTECSEDRLDLLSMPKAGALVGTDLGGEILVSAQLGRVMAERDFDIELEVLASPPGMSWLAERVAVSQASGDQVNVLLPAGIAPGDDLVLVAREAGGEILDTGVVVRMMAEPSDMVRTDALLYGDLVSLAASGVTGYTEGVVELVWRSESRNLTIDRAVLYASKPGQVGNGFGSFDATFDPPLTDDSGDLSAALPHNGELMSISRVLGNGSLLPLGCFEYCNDLAGDGTCSGGPRSCP